MQVYQYKMTLGQEQVKECNPHIRMFKLSNINCHYYSKQNLLTSFDQLGGQVYIIDQNSVQLHQELTYRLREKLFQPDQVFFLDNHIVVYQANHFIKFNIENFDQCQIFQRPKTENIQSYNQINRNSFMTIAKVDNRIRIYQLRNLKISHTQLNRFRITATQYQKHIVQAFAYENLYYYNTRMTKQIRKYEKCQYCDPTFNQNYLFVPMKRYNPTHLIIYDIQSMKIKGTILLQTNGNQSRYSSCILIRDFNVLGILYQNRLDLYEFTSLKWIKSEKYTNQQQINKLMKYDHNSGLSIFFNDFIIL